MNTLIKYRCYVDNQTLDTQSRCYWQIAGSDEEAIMKFRRVFGPRLKTIYFDDSATTIITIYERTNR